MKYLAGHDFRVKANGSETLMKLPWLEHIDCNRNFEIVAMQSVSADAHDTRRMGSFAFFGPSFS